MSKDLQFSSQSFLLSLFLSHFVQLPLSVHPLETRTEVKMQNKLGDLEGLQKTIRMKTKELKKKRYITAARHDDSIRSNDSS